MKKGIIANICIMIFVIMLSSCATLTERTARKLDPSFIYPIYETKPINIKSQSKCPSPPSVKLVNNETRNGVFPVENMPGYKTTLEAEDEFNPKDLMNHIINYMSDAFRKCQVDINGSSTKMIEVSIDNVAMKITSPFTPMGAGIRLKVNISEIQYTQIYAAEEWSGRHIFMPSGPEVVIAYTIHLVTWKIINDPVIQDYILCR